ncbi:putative purine permease, plant [Medicago truncatula]|uniref:Probable purine permease n=1 Tax=Medicago truncatula TaxID=3880 RepID=A0A396IZT2_MEDTR|nr:putative purine permease, plant [Medicago truncatula]
MEDGKKQVAEKKMKRFLLVVNCLILSLGTCSAPLIMRLYFIHGGQRVWLSAFLQTAGFPLMLIPLAISYIKRHRLHHHPPPLTTISIAPEKLNIISMKPPIFFAAAFIGILTGLDDYLFAYGVARLPVSTSALIIASQLGFTAFFAFLIVKEKFTAFTVNAVVLLTVGAGVLAMHTSSDRPAGVSAKQYWISFSTTFVTCMFATLFCAIGMIANNDFKVIPKEARNFGLGESTYYVVLVVSAIMWQAFFLGAIGVIFCASSLLSGILIAVLLPLTEVLAVVFYKEKFQAEKGVSLVLSLWGFVSYFYGEIKHAKAEKKKCSLEIKMGQTLEGLPAP